jgi:hypothetical protein
MLPRGNLHAGYSGKHAKQYFVWHVQEMVTPFDSGHIARNHSRAEPLCGGLGLKQIQWAVPKGDLAPT